MKKLAQDKKHFEGKLNQLFEVNSLFFSFLSRVIIKYCGDPLEQGQFLCTVESYTVFYERIRKPNTTKNYIGCLLLRKCPEFFITVKRLNRDNGNGFECS